MAKRFSEHEPVPAQVDWARITRAVKEVEPLIWNKIQETIGQPGDEFVDYGGYRIKKGKVQRYPTQLVFYVELIVPQVTRPDPIAVAHLMTEVSNLDESNKLGFILSSLSPPFDGHPKPLIEPKEPQRMTFLFQPNWDLFRKIVK